MKLFMDEEFLLSTETAKKLYHEYAEKMPILDYHCHIESAKRSMRTGKFDNITQVWLGGDHYKWRQMRSNGVEESYITGDASLTGKNSRNGQRHWKCAIGNPAVPLESSGTEALFWLSWHI